MDNFAKPGHEERRTFFEGIAECRLQNDEWGESLNRSLLPQLAPVRIPCPIRVNSRPFAVSNPSSLSPLPYPPSSVPLSSASPVCAEIVDGFCHGHDGGRSRRAAAEVSCPN